MCKIMVMTGIQPEAVEGAWAFTEEMSRLMSMSNRDGIGYAALTHSGELFGERWLHNDDAFDLREGQDKTIGENKELIAESKELAKDLEGVLELESLLKKTPPIEERYSKFGDITKETFAGMCSITLHARLATSGKGIINNHPFVNLKEQTTLIHNGIIHNPTEYGDRYSDCDSEAILNGYIEKKIAEDPFQIEIMINRLRGYFACGVISTNKDGWFVDVFKENQANLGAVYVKELNSLVITTQPADAFQACELLGFHITAKFSFKDNRLIRFNPFNGAVVEKIQYVHRPSFHSYSSNEEYNIKTRRWEKKDYTKKTTVSINDARSSKVDTREADAIIASAMAETNGWHKIGTGEWEKNDV